MKKVYSAHHSAEAHLVKGLLENEGIHALVRGEELAGARGGVPVTIDTSPTVWVFEDSDFEKALEVVERYDRGMAAEVGGKPPWQCPSCGEQNEPQFTACWKCGADRSGLLPP